MLLLVGAGVGACHSPGSGGQIEAKWGGRDSGRVSAPARGAWCPPAKLFKLTGVKDDAGVGLAIYPVDSLTSGDYPVIDPGSDSTTRPRSVLAVRWFTEQEIQGYQGDTGIVSITRKGSMVAGRIDATMFRAATYDTIHLSGTFRAVRMSDDSDVCAVDSVQADTADTVASE